MPVKIVGTYIRNITISIKNKSKKKEPLKAQTARLSNTITTQEITQISKSKRKV